MNKLLVKIKYPLISQEYELFIPINKSIGKITDLIQKAIIEFNVEEIPLKKNAVLIKADTNEILDYTKLVYDSNIKNGDTLVIL